MPSETSAGAVVFRRENEEILFLLLHYHYKSGYWDFIKGNVEPKEDEKDAAIRETREETGIKDLKFIGRFKEKIGYMYKKDGKTVFKHVIYFLAETETKEVKLSEEHIGFEWLPYEEAYSRITFKNSKAILKKANEFLKKNEESRTLKDFF